MTNQPTRPIEALPTLAEATRLWARIGCLSFGGPAGQIALMHRLLVEERGWIGDARFVRALNFCMLLPGPEAQQLATYIGWLLHGRRGGVIAGLLFVLPGALVMLALSIAALRYGAHPLTAAVLLGVKAAVVAIVAQALVRISARTLHGTAAWALAAAAFAAIFLLGAPFPLIVFAAGGIGLAAPAQFHGHRHAARGGGDGLIDRAIAAGRVSMPRPGWRMAARTLALWLPLWLGPAAAALLIAGPGFWRDLTLFFSSVGLVTFGGAYAVLAYAAQAADAFGWLSAREVADGLGLAETTPGPLILVLQHIGFVAAAREGGMDPLTGGVAGAVFASWIIFAPSFLWIFLGAPWMEAIGDRPRLQGALAAIGAATVGVIANLALWFAIHLLFTRQVALGAAELPVLDSLDWRAAAIAAVAAVLLFAARWPVTAVIALSAAMGAATGLIA